MTAAPTKGSGVTAGGLFVGGLWLVWAILLAGGLWAGYSSLEAGSFLRQWGRLGSSFTLVWAGWVWLANCRGTTAARYALLIAIGMTLGALGDVFMAGLLQSAVPLPDPALGGIAAFGLGHVAYITACWVARRRCDLKSPAAWWGSVLAWQLVGLVSWYFIVYPTGEEKLLILRWPALVYTLLLACTAGVSMALALQEKRFAILSLGAALFLLSDVVLAWGMFNDPLKYQTLAVWIPYGVGQMMIVYGIVTARGALCRG